MRVHSITLKLTLALLGVGILGALMVGLFVDYVAVSAFDRFKFEQGRGRLLALLSEYYSRTGSLEGVDRFLPGGVWAQGPDERRMMVSIADADGVVVYGGQLRQPGRRVGWWQLRRAAPIEFDGVVVGYLINEAFVGRFAPGSPESNFLRGVAGAVRYSAIGAAVVALLVAVILARTLTQPIRTLTDATRALGAGNLGHQVEVRGADELGELAASFNKMSSDIAESNRLRQQMTADIAHDLRTPLSVLTGYTEALCDGKLQGSSAIFAVMHDEARHLGHLIDDLRLLSLADAGELTLNLQRVSPEALLEQTAAAHWVKARDQDIELVVRAAPDLPLIAVDPDRMSQVLGNLVTNALRYTPPGGCVVLSAEANAADRELILRVSDTGAGIAESALPHVFERFYRADKSRSQDGSESGLGLAIVKSLVELHGGRVSVESAVGSGTTFSIKLATQHGAAQP